MYGIPNIQEETEPKLLRGVKPAPEVVPAWVVTKSIGMASEIWIERQVRMFRRVRPHVVCWNDHSGEPGSNGEFKRSVVPSEASPCDGRRRWIVRMQNLGGRNFYGSVGAERRHLLDLAQHSRPRVILCHFGSTALRMLPIAKHIGIPVVAHFHGSDMSSGLRNRWYRWSLLKHLKHFAAIVVVGAHQRSWMLEQGVPEDRIHLIPCGVPTGCFLPSAKPQTDPIRFIAVSRLVAWKGVVESLESFSLVHQDIPEARFVFIGDGPEANRLKERALALGVEKVVTFDGARPSGYVAEQMQQSHIFLQHSLQLNGCCEGFGISLAEAASSGLPVVATRCGGIVDQVVDGETGILVDQYDVSGMARAMLRLASESKLRARMGKAGRVRMIEHFDTARQVCKLENVMAAVADEAGS